MKEDVFESNYSSIKFRNEGHQTVDRLADHLEKAMSGTGEVIHYTEPEEELLFWSNYQFTSDDIFYKDLLNHTIHLHNPRYVGHQVAVPLPGLALYGLTSDLLNNGMGVYEMGQGPTAMERIVIKELAIGLGFDEKSDGYLTSGGTLANLTALLAAREKLRATHSSKLVLFVSEQAHFCIERAAMTMGMQKNDVIKIKTNDQYQIDLKHIEHSFETVSKEGRQVLAIVGCACSTATGAYDDLKALGKFCQEQNIWFHVDGAHGAVAAFSSKYKNLVEGIDMADSVVLDAHKMMMVPALCTAVLFQKSEDSYRSFMQDAEYLFEQKDPEWFQLAKRTYETTKYMMSVKLFVLLKKYGISIIDDFVTRQYDLVRRFANKVRNHSEFELGHEPMSNIVCFRYIGKSDISEKKDTVNAKLRKCVLHEGYFYLVQTVLRGSFYLRITLMNPLTTLEHLEELLTYLSQKAKSL